jgi:hypothetical protein
MWVREIAVTGKWIYAVLHGHHLGEIVRTPTPAHPLGEESSTTEQYQLMSEELSKAENVSEGEYLSGICACEVKGRSRLFFYERNNLMLWEGKGTEKVIGKLPDP